MKESERVLLRAYARLGNFAEAGMEAHYTEISARRVAARLEIEAGPLGRPPAGSLSDRIALATFIIEGYNVSWAIRRLKERFSENGVFRILRSVRENQPRFSAVAAVISHPEDDQKILVCREKEAHEKYGKRVGDVTVPMGFKGKTETNEAALRRVVLREVFADPGVIGDGSWADWYQSHLEVETKDPIARVLVFDTLALTHHLRLKVDPDVLGGFSSGVTYDHQWVSLKEAKEKTGAQSGDFRFRSGVTKMLEEYGKHLVDPEKFLKKEKEIIRSQLHTELAKILVEERPASATA